MDIVSHTAVWLHAGKSPLPIRWMLIRGPKSKFTSQALLCTDPSVNPAQILEWFVMHWQVEITFHKVQTRMGVETQRQWSDRAIAQTARDLLGLVSLVTLLADRSVARGKLLIRQTAWYSKVLPPFSDALAVDHHQL